MKKLIIITILLMVTTVFARKPAVDDIVGLDGTKDLPMLNEETRTLYNFEQELANYQQEHPMENNYHWLLLLGILGLPFVSWIVITKSYLRNKNEKFEENVRIMAKYKQTSKTDNADDQNFPKAS